jgi:hypothetical protein
MTKILGGDSFNQNKTPKPIEGRRDAALHREGAIEVMEP